MKIKLSILCLVLFFTTIIAQESLNLTILNKSVIAYKIDSVQENIDDFRSVSYINFIPVDTIYKNDVISLKRPVHIGLQTISYNEGDYNYFVTNDDTFINRNKLDIALNLNTFDLFEWVKLFKVKDNTPERQVKKSIDISSFEKEQSRLQVSLKTMSKINHWHEHLTIFTGGLEFNFSHQRFLDFLKYKMGITEVSQNYQDDYIISKCKESISYGNPKTIIVKYKVKSKDGYFFPESLDITGDNQKVIMLFIAYWSTKIQIEEVKNETQLYSYYLPDKITLSLDHTGKAKISIVNSL